MNIQEPKYILHSDKHLDLIFSNGEMYSLIKGYHRNFGVIVSKLKDPTYNFTEQEALRLVETKESMTGWLQKLSSRISFRESHMYFRGELVNPYIADAMRACYEAGKPFVGAYLRFLENVAENPSEEAREALSSWVNFLARENKPFVITETGMLVAHRMTEVRGSGTEAKISDGGSLSVLVNGEKHSDELYYPAKVGSVVEMEYKPEERDIHEGIHGIAVNYWSDSMMGTSIYVEARPQDVLAFHNNSSHKSLMVKQVLIIGADEGKPVISGVLPETYNGGWVEEEFAQWKINGLPLDMALEYENMGYTFEQALMSSV